MYLLLSVLDNKCFLLTDENENFLPFLSILSTELKLVLGVCLFTVIRIDFITCYKAHTLQCTQLKYDSEYFYSFPIHIFLDSFITSDIQFTCYYFYLNRLTLLLVSMSMIQTFRRFHLFRTDVFNC